MQSARVGDLPRPVIVVLASVTLGVLAGAVGATPEARFAMPLIVLGIAGTLLVRVDQTPPRQVGVVVALVVLVVFLGHRGLSHPAPAGGATPEICAATAALLE